MRTGRVRRQTALNARETIEGALVTQVLDPLRNAEQAARACATAARLATDRHQGGLIGFLAVLEAERTELQSEDALARDRTVAAAGLVSVY